MMCRCQGTLGARGLGQHVRKEGSREPWHLCAEWDWLGGMSVFLQPCLCALFLCQRGCCCSWPGSREGVPVPREL